MSLRKILKSKLHGATVTHADIHYEGSITLPPELMLAANLYEYEAVYVWDVTNGARLETYVIEGQAGSSIISINGAAARLIQASDKIIVACFEFLNEQQLVNYQPKLVFLDDNNHIKQIRKEVPGPILSSNIAC